MRRTTFFLIPLTIAAVAAGCTEGGGGNGGDDGDAAETSSRSQVRVVGSSTVYPFSSYVAEEFGATTEHPTPVIESTGSGGGIKIFCEGDGLDTADITNASRRMKASEFERCAGNGVTEITEIAIGADGITIAQAKDKPALDLTLEQLTLAVIAKVPQDGELVDNPYERWNEIDESLPDREITVYGPPSTSGTRDAFEELVLEAATENMEGYDEPVSSVRDDGPYVSSGENDNLIVQKIENDREAVGIFGYSFLEENRDVIAAVTIDGVNPTPEAISSGEYPVARSLFFYTKNSHLGRVPGMTEYVELFISDQMIGDQGLLRREGLIPLPAERREAIRERFAERETLEAGDLE
ncbi:PstS family phosphate ABC transporter substrate-binding protein [Halofilum ochraceum]|uniref:PstS family phosphate ABC transporter substrate-binding protein n=1 Tax=Halofilum ochraceum TaxID=1611323 RepID=UPI0009F1B28D|nr:PstS family phosphate ABC transporter substrate-binding protein [Halofilum ochraceum]